MKLSIYSTIVLHQEVLLILDTVYGEVKIGVHRDGAGYACEVLRKLKDAAK